MRGKNILSLSLILMFVTIMMMDIGTVQATSYEYELYVDGFTGNWVDWNTGGSPPVSPYLNAHNDDSYIEGTFDGALMGGFTFDDINLPPCQVITKVVLEGYTNGPFNLNVDFDVYTVPDFVWLGSLYATEPPAWVTRRWYPTWTVDKVYEAALTEAGLNSLEVLLYFFDPYHAGGDDNILDALRLRVYTAISATIDIDPDNIKLDNKAQYLTCYIEPCPAFSAYDIDRSTVKLNGIPALASPPPPPGIDDNIPPPPNPNGIPDLHVKFNMTKVKTHIVDDLLGGKPPDPGDTVYVKLTITGDLISGYHFAGRYTIGVKG